MEDVKTKFDYCPLTSSADVRTEAVDPGAISYSLRRQAEADFDDPRVILEFSHAEPRETSAEDRSPVNRDCPHLEPVVRGEQKPFPRAPVTHRACRVEYSKAFCALGHDCIRRRLLWQRVFMYLTFSRIGEPTAI